MAAREGVSCTTTGVIAHGAWAPVTSGGIGGGYYVSTSTGKFYYSANFSATSTVEPTHTNPAGQIEFDGHKWDYVGNTAPVFRPFGIIYTENSTGFSVPTYTVAALPTGSLGMVAMASNGRKSGEGAGAGTGRLWLFMMERHGARATPPRRWPHDAR